MSDENNLVISFEEALSAFSEIDNPTLSDISGLAATLTAILENTSEEVDEVTMAQAIKLLLNTFIEGGLSDAEYVDFYNKLIEDSSEEEFLTDIQYLIYDYVSDMVGPTSSSSVINVDSLVYPAKIMPSFYAMVSHLFLSIQSYVDVINFSNALTTFALNVDPTSFDSVVSAWKLAMNSLTDAGESETLIADVGIHFEAVKSLCRRLCYTLFASTVYTYSDVIDDFISANPDFGSSAQLLKDCMAKHDGSSTGLVAGVGINAGIDTFKTVTRAQGMYSYVQYDTLADWFNQNISNYWTSDSTTSNSLKTASLYSTNTTSQFGLYAIPVSPDTALGLISDSYQKLFTLTTVSEEQKDAFNTLTDEISNSDGVTASNLYNYGTTIYNILMEGGVLKEQVNSSTAVFNSEINSAITSDFQVSLSAVVDKSYADNWLAFLPAYIASVLVNSSGEYVPVETIQWISTFVTELYYSIINVEEKGLSASNFMLIQIEILKYLSLFLNKDQLDTIGGQMMRFFNSFEAEQEAEEAEAEMIEMIIQIVIAAVLLIASIAVTVVTFGAAGPEVAVLDAVVIGAEVTGEVAGDVAADVTGELVSEATAEAVEETGSETAADVVEEESGEVVEDIESATEDTAEDVSQEADDEPSEEDDTEEESKDESNEDENSNEDQEECNKNFSTWISSVAESGSLLWLISAIMSEITAIATLDATSSINNITSIVNIVSGSLSGLCSQKSSSQNNSGFILSVVGVLNGSITTIYNTAMDLVPDETTDMEIAEESWDLIAKLYATLAALVGFVQLLIGIATAEGGMITNSLINGIKNNSGNLSSLASMISGIPDFIDGVTTTTEAGENVVITNDDGEITLTYGSEVIVIDNYSNE